MTALLCTALVALVALLSGGCGHRARAVPAPSEPRETEPDADHGTSSVRFMTERRAVEPGQELQPPRPKSPLSLPEYPPAALAAHAGDAMVVLRFVVNTEGNVTDVAESPLGGSSPGGFAGLFRAAAEAAVRSWRYEPAELQWVVPGSDMNGDGKPDFRRVIRREIIPVYLDVQFSFRIVSGKPQVR